MPSMVGNVRASRIVFKISLMFLSSGFKTSASFSYIRPTAVSARNFVDNIALEIQGLPELRRRKFLLQGFSCKVLGETGRCFKTRRKEHQRNLKNYTRGSNIANHAWHNNHSIDFEGATVIDKGNHRVRRTLESWHTAKTVGADNNSKPLPRQYSILL